MSTVSQQGLCLNVLLTLTIYPKKKKRVLTLAAWECYPCFLSLYSCKSAPRQAHLYFGGLCFGLHHFRGPTNIHKVSLQQAKLADPPKPSRQSAKQKKDSRLAIKILVDMHIVVHRTIDIHRFDSHKERTSIVSIFQQWWTMAFLRFSQAFLSIDIFWRKNLNINIHQ